MGLLPVIVGVQDINGLPVNKAALDGTQKAIMLELGAGFAATQRDNGGTQVVHVEIAAASGGYATAVVDLPALRNIGPGSRADTQLRLVKGGNASFYFNATSL